MNLEELEALRDVTPGIGQKTIIIDGKIRRVPIVLNECGALFQNPDDVIFRDQSGAEWITGWLGNEHVRRRI